MCHVLDEGDGFLCFYVVPEYGFAGWWADVVAETAFDFYGAFYAFCHYRGVEVDDAGFGVGAPAAEAVFVESAEVAEPGDEDVEEFGVVYEGGYVGCLHGAH